MDTKKLINLKGAYDTYLIGDDSIFESKYYPSKPFARKISSFVYEKEHSPNQLIVKGDLLSDMFIEMKLPGLIKPDNADDIYWKYDAPLLLLKKVSLRIDGIIMEEYPGTFIRQYYNMFAADEKKIGLSQLLSGKENVIIPMVFWFCQNSVNAYPCGFAENSKMEILLDLEEIDQCYVVSPQYSVECSNIFPPLKKRRYTYSCWRQNKIYKI